MTHNDEKMLILPNHISIPNSFRKNVALVYLGDYNKGLSSKKKICEIAK